MIQRMIENPVTRERITFIETSRETGGARTVAELEVGSGGGVPRHRHADHDERIEVLEGQIEVTVGRRTHRVGAGGHVVLERGKAHSWRNPLPGQRLRFRAQMTPGHPGFERFLRVLFGLARDGQVRKSGLPKRFADLALLREWDPSILAGPLRLLEPFMRWSARRSSARGRAAELLRRYAGEVA